MILTPHIVINSDHNNKLENAVKGHTWDRKCQKAFWTNSRLPDSTNFPVEVSTKKIATEQGNGMIVKCSVNGKTVAYAKFLSAPIVLPWSRRVYAVDMIRVHSDWIGHDIAPNLYNWMSQQGITVLSDAQQTPQSLAVWHKLGTTGKVFTVDMRTGIWRSYDPLKIEDWMLFGNGNPMWYWGVRFVLPAK